MMTTPLTTNQLEAATAATPYPTDVTVATCAEWNAKITALEERWVEWLKQESWSGLPKSLHNEIFQKAWADGHSEGYIAVQYAYERYVDFAQTSIEAYQNERG